MSPELLARIVRVFYRRQYRKNPQRALALAIKYYAEFVRSLNEKRPHSHLFPALTTVRIDQAGATFRAHTLRQ
jgi:hypothetical protein